MSPIDSPKRLAAIALLAAIILLLSISRGFCGIHRHDVNVKKYFALAQKRQFACVGHFVILRNGRWVRGGTGVLIRENFVLTTRHLFFDEISKETGIQDHGISVSTYLSIGMKPRNPDSMAIFFNGKRYSIAKIIYNDSNIVYGAGSDIALVRLTRNVPGVRTPLLNRAFDELNSEVVGVGFGYVGPANDPSALSKEGRKLAGQNVIDSIGGAAIGTLPSRLYMDFDIPDASCADCNKMGSKVPQPLEYTITGGDSGGGLFRKKKGRWELVGSCPGGGIEIDSFRKHRYYCQVAEWRRVSLFVPWILSVLREASD